MIDRLLIIKVQHTLTVNPLVFVAAHFVVVRRLAVQSVLDFAARTFEVVFAVVHFDSKYVVAVGQLRNFCEFFKTASLNANLSNLSTYALSSKLSTMLIWISALHSGIGHINGILLESMETSRCVRMQSRWKKWAQHSSQYSSVMLTPSSQIFHSPITSFAADGSSAGTSDAGVCSTSMESSASSLCEFSIVCLILCGCSILIEC